MKTIKTILSLFAMFIFFSCSNNPSEKSEADQIQTTENIDTVASEENKYIADKSNSAGFKKDNKGISDLYQYFEKPVQVFQIAGDRDTIITCKEGTKIRVKPNSFISEKGDFVKNVILKIKEYYKIEDILLSNLSTSSSEGILKTGGILNIEAIAGKIKCSLAKGKTVEIRFPEGEKKKGMELYSGEEAEGKIIWSPTGPNTPKYGGLRENMEREKFNNYDKEEYLSITKDDTAKPEILRKNYKTEAAYKRAVKANLKEEIKEDKATASSITWHVLRTSTLGWICCAHASPFNGEKTKYRVYVHNWETDVKIVFKDVNAVALGRRTNFAWEFEDFPVGQPIKIIAVKFDRGDYYLAVKDSVIVIDGAPDLKYEKVKMHDLKAEMRRVSAESKN